MKKIFTILLVVVGLFTKAQQAATVIFSPDGNIAFKLTAQDKMLKYAVEYRKQPVIKPSLLGLVINGKLVGEDAVIKKNEQYKMNETFAQRGVHDKAINKYTQATIYINGDMPFVIEVKVFNDGVAFRYIFNNKDSSTVEKDNTEFVMPAGSIMWIQSNIKYYEGKYFKAVSDTIKQGQLIGPPATIELPSNAGYVTITEGGLTDFAGMSLIAKGNNSFAANLSGKTKKPGKIETPWRIIEIGKDLNTLANCDIISSVSPAYDNKLFPGGYNTSWIKPGRSVWSWLAKTRLVTLQNMKHFSDLAAQLGFEYNLVDEGWSNWKDSINHKDNWDMIKELVDYSAARGVKIWVWKAYPDRKGITGIKEEKQRKAFFKKCKDIGIVGLKVDFFDNEAQDIIQFYQAALHDAAEYHLMMDFHGANKPTGETRTWPNEMTREAVRGLENRPPYAYTNSIIPFTRYLAGHADFTPLHFGDRLGETTWAHQVASMIVFTSPFLCLGADPQSILDNPCKEMIQSIPTTWDETIVLPQSKIGELVLFARRKGTAWFIAAMNGTNEPEKITLPLNFLKGKYNFSSIQDDSNKQDSAVLKNITVLSGASITINLNANGGYVTRLTK